ncbi:hypothetical protein Pgy4_31031, partial [Pseudomonas savastanoi pv. glycinea str. race 4]
TRTGELSEKKLYKLVMRRLKCFEIWTLGYQDLPREQ